MTPLLTDWLAANPDGFRVKRLDQPGTDRYVVDWYVRGDRLVVWYVGDGGDDGRDHSLQVRFAEVHVQEPYLAVATHLGMYELAPIAPYMRWDDVREEVERWRGYRRDGKAFGWRQGRVFDAAGELIAA